MSLDWSGCRRPLFEFTGHRCGDRASGLEKGKVMASERGHTDDAIEFIRKIAAEVSSPKYPESNRGAFAQAAAMVYAANVLASALRDLQASFEAFGTDHALLQGQTFEGIETALSSIADAIGTARLPTVALRRPGSEV
jgi:hypothetical protein